MSRPGAAVNIILITDEDRDILADFSHTFGNVLTNLGSKSALLNVVANQARYTRVSSAINHQCLSQVLSHLEHTEGRARRSASSARFRSIIRSACCA